MSILGTRVLRTEDPRFLTVGGVYTADLRIDGVAHVTFVRSSYAHARVTSIDTTEARSAPGCWPCSPPPTSIWRPSPAGWG